MPTITKQQALNLNYPRRNLQTILIPIVNSLADSKHWLKANQYKTKPYRSTVHFRRFMQHKPVEGADYHSDTLDNGIILVYQQY